MSTHPTDILQALAAGGQLTAEQQASPAYQQLLKHRLVMLGGFGRTLEPVVTAEGLGLLGTQRFPGIVEEILSSAARSSRPSTKKTRRGRR